MNQEILLLQLILHQVLVSDEFFEGRKLLYFPSKIIDKNSSFTQQLPPQDTMFTQQEILEIAALPETAFRFRCHVDALISLYKWVREQWTAKAIAEHRHKYELDCRTTEGKLRFALTAARELSQGVLPPVIAETSSASSTDNNRDVQTSRILSQAIALLPYTPTNGLENAPAYRVLGSPISADSLVENYKILAKKWHPDLNTNPEASERFDLISDIYQTLKGNWFTRYSPLIAKEKFRNAQGIPNFNTIYQAAYSVKLRFSPESFWG